jgi:hypothetical protein
MAEDGAQPKKERKEPKKSAIIIYTCYVYIGRFLVPMLEQSDKALASRATGSECS